LRKLILSLDLGTTAIKTAIYTNEGNLLDTTTIEYDLITPQVNWVEQKPEVYWEAIKDGLNEMRKKVSINPEEIKAMALSAQGETLFFTDQEGNSLRNAIVWMDNRAQKEAEQLEEKFTNDTCYQVTGQVSFEACWPAAKILWVKKNEPEIFEKTAYFMLIEDYIIFKLTGKLVSEGSLLCSTTYWDINTKEYWPEMLEYLGITPEQLPAVMESGMEVGAILPQAAKDLGLSTSTIVCTGALDQAAGAIGVGNIFEGVFSENIGAALAICVPVKKPVFDPNRNMPLHYFAIPDMYMIHTFTTGGMTLRWFRDMFCEIGTYEEMDKLAADVLPGSEGLVMLPHLTGSMAPDVNSKAKGVYFGFTLKHTKAHFIRAIMESVGYIIKRNIDALAGMNINISELRSLGGGAKSTLWNQIKADITQKQIKTMESEEAACLGAAILAGKATGLFSSIEDAVENMVKVKNVVNPNQENQHVYEKGYENYKKLFDDLKSMFDTSYDQ